MSATNAWSKLAAAAACVLAGCGGGGGGGGMPIQPFTAWSAVQPSSRVNAGGMSQSVSATYTVQPSGDLLVTLLGTASAVDTSNSSVTYTFDPTRNLNGIQLTTPSTSASWSSATLGGSSVGCSMGVCLGTNASGDSAYIGIDPYAVGWNYQTFGVWATGGSTSGTVGVISVGAPTPVNAIPTTGTANYTGASFGYYVNGAGNVFGYGGQMSAAADFDNRLVTFSTSNTMLSDNSGGPPISRTDLNLQGTLSYAAGTNQFSGTVNTTGQPLTGSASGRFYGPAYEEIGGVYTLRNGGTLESILGGFGGKR
jgi:hypothetical protein